MVVTTPLLPGPGSCTAGAYQKSASPRPKLHMQRLLAAEQSRRYVLPVGVTPPFLTHAFPTAGTHRSADPAAHPSANDITCSTASTNHLQVARHGRRERH